MSKGGGPALWIKRVEGGDHEVREGRRMIIASRDEAILAVSCRDLADQRLFERILLGVDPQLGEIFIEETVKRRPVHDLVAPGAGGEQPYRPVESYLMGVEPTIRRQPTEDCDSSGEASVTKAACKARQLNDRFLGRRWRLHRRKQGLDVRVELMEFPSSGLARHSRKLG
ncbi:hypothetical protein GCM10009093_27360 [Brevundimonas terrae]|uniref:Uncharacterized protein n=1 Tax=Brevundimonas terrae TaxID=363631 RepID=A0ABP3IGE8_9CAUL